mgnify:CR=1 FL=1
MKEKIIDAIKEPLEEIDVKVYDISLEKEDNIDTLFIRLDGELVDTDLCEKASKIISPIIDELDLGLDDYVLDICSKGEYDE